MLWQCLFYVINHRRIEYQLLKIKVFVSLRFLLAVWCYFILLDFVVYEVFNFRLINTLKSQLKSKKKKVFRFYLTVKFWLSLFI